MNPDLLTNVRGRVFNQQVAAIGEHSDKEVLTLDLSALQRGLDSTQTPF